MICILQKHSLKAAICLVPLIFSACFILCSAAKDVNIKIDGDVSDWQLLGKNETLITEKKKNDGNDLETASVKCVTDDSSNCVYYLFQSSWSPKSDEESDLGNIGLELNLDSAEPFKVKISDIPEGKSVLTYEQTDKETYSLWLAMKLYGDAGNQMYCEVKVNYKDGIGSEKGGKVQFFDLDGVGSNTFSFSFANSAYTVSAASSTTSAAKAKTTSGSKSASSATRAISTGRAATTERKTVTRRQNSASETSVTTAKTTAKSASTTKKRSSSAKTKTTAAPSSYVDGGNVYYVYGGETAAASSETQTSDSSAFEISSLPKSALMKIIAGAAAFLLFGAIGIAAVTGRNEEKKKESHTTIETEDKKKED